MARNFKCDTHGLLQAQEFERLGQIVVVCGKNNSGKSTLLTAIEHGAPCLGAKELPQLKLANCLRFYPDNHPWDKSGAVIDKVSREIAAWTRKDVAVFLKALKEELSTWQFHSHKLMDFTEEILSIYEESFEEHKAILVPPKRVLELSGDIQNSRKVQPSGRGLLNFLFHAANRFENTPERMMLEDIRRLFYDVSDGYEFFVELDGSVQKLSFRRAGGIWVPSEQCGLGLQDLLVLLYFIVNDEYNLVIIEEPESHMHPEMQRKLLHVCKDRDQKQFFFSTHSSVFLDLTLVDTILHTEIRDDAIKVSDDTSRAVILDSLGYSVTDNLVSDLILLVEGPSDKPVVEEFLRQMGLYRSYSIKVWPLGGDIMDKCDLSVFIQTYTIMALIDTDPGSMKVRNRFKRKCKEVGIPVHQLKRRAIENYFTLDALRSVFSSQIPNELLGIDPDESVEKQTGLSVKKRNHDVAKAMTLDDIRGTDLYTFLQAVESTLFQHAQ